jgi:TonB family protein
MIPGRFCFSANDVSGLEYPATMSLLRLHSAVFVLLLFSSTVTLNAQSDELNQHLNEGYQGKTLLLRGFYSADRLHYDASGTPDNTTSGDWTVDGFVQVSNIRFSDDRLTIKGRRAVAFRSDKNQLVLRPGDRSKGIGKANEAAHIEIQADTGMHNPSDEQVDALLNKIFLTSQDSIVDLVPNYWKACVSGGLKGTDHDCVFASDLLSVAGFAITSANEGMKAEVAAQEPYGSPHGIFRVGSGVRPPRVIYQQDPEFSGSARATRYQGVVGLVLVVDKDGKPRNISISRPLGYGLDEKEVQAVSTWKFKPAERDGIPVNVEIAVEVNFRLY